MRVQAGHESIDSRSLQAAKLDRIDIIQTNPLLNLVQQTPFSTNHERLDGRRLCLAVREHPSHQREATADEHSRQYCSNCVGAARHSQAVIGAKLGMLAPMSLSITPSNGVGRPIEKP